MTRCRFLMVGGFLGAGKTTLIARLAKHYTDQGLRVGLVTNDQAYDLVDTHSLRAQGFDVGEVPGACFCCKFDDLVDTAAKLTTDTAPDIIITEPVGSCTDLVATVIEPLRALHQDNYEVGPLAVLMKPEHGAKILRNDSGGGFSPQAAYIFLKQLEEADVIALNKIDKLGEAETQELLALVRERFPDTEVLAISGRDGDHCDELWERLSQPRGPRRATMEVDYDVYAEGEAELGWLNCQSVMTANEGETPLDELVLQVVQAVAEKLVAAGIEPAHLKVLGQSGDTPAIANLVSSGVESELSLESGARTARAELIVNARVAADPETLESLVTEALQACGKQAGMSVEITGMQRFRPGRPVPTHRMS